MSNSPRTEPLIDSPDGPRLVGGRCSDCRAVVFPFRPTCPSCGVGKTEVETLPSIGTLWSWTIQGFPPKPPYVPLHPDSDFEPFGVGYVELPDALRIETVLTTADPDRLRIGQSVRLTTIGTADRRWFAFEPIDGAATAEGDAG